MRRSRGQILGSPLGSHSSRRASSNVRNFRTGILVLEPELPLQLGGIGRLVTEGAQHVGETLVGGRHVVQQ